ncbi:hypothetical protein [[Mycobacterium] crassicus]|uniref:Uncharacterized protein n=1 Tax=[Mycobacterium] crassicus TaxID=2872309 RepID=A0ABU5XJX5_9MYCO|nr:hypothetical protein [Mycolicibacter sp. MYC098]MEB3022077.1 hypothetical protein [Mycolicibacter sp. MYC098]
MGGWRTIRRYGLRACGVSAVLAACIAGGWLFFGGTIGGVLIGAVIGYLFSIVFPQVSGFLRNNGTPSGKFDRLALFDTLFISVLTAALAWYGVLVFQTWSVTTVEALHSVTVVQPFPSGRMVAYGVVRDGGRYVAVGYFRPDGGGDAYLDAALWESQDGFSWSRLNHDHELQGGVALADGRVAHRHMRAIAPTSNGFLIVGQDNAYDGIPRGRVWRLRPGMDVVEAVTDLQFPPAVKYTGYQEHDEKKLLVGNNTENAVAWLKTGQGDWQAVHDFGARATTEVESVKYLNKRWIAVGVDRTTDPRYSVNLSEADNAFNTDGAIWVSSNGIDWDQAEGFARVDHSQRVNDVVYLHGMWVAVGDDDTSDQRDMDPALWASEDAMHWHRLDLRSIQGATGYQGMSGAVVMPGSQSILAVGAEVAPPVPGSDERVQAAPGEKPWRIAIWQIAVEPQRGARTVPHVARNIAGMVPA